jgi:hypothetical protein
MVFDLPVHDGIGQVRDNGGLALGHALLTNTALHTLQAYYHCMCQRMRVNFALKHTFILQRCARTCHHCTTYQEW